MDDVVVGGGTSKAGTPADEFGSSAAQVDNSGPLDERLMNKNWSIRAQAFDELTLLFKGAQSEKDQVFKDHCSNWKKYLADANPGALEKCLDSLQAFIDIGDPKVVVISQNDVIKQLIERCIGHAKPTIRQKGLECFNLLFEVTEIFDDSVETMVECLNAKNIKVGEAAQKTLNSWLSNFGAKKIKLKPFMKVVETNANSSNPQIRSEAMNFYKECYKWLGEGLKPLIEDLKKQQKDDLDKAFEEIKDKPKTIRYTRSEKKAQKDSMIDGIIKQEEDNSMASSAAYDLADAVDLLIKYNPEWQDKILDLKKWNEKKELLEQLISESNVPKLQNGDFSGLVKTLKKLIGDPNQVVSQLAIKACGNLAKGLRQDFGEANCRELMSTLINKFKEKKTQIINEVHVVLDAFIDCTDLEVLSPDIAAAISDIGPTVKTNICSYLERIVQLTYIDVLQRSSPDLIAALLKSCEDQMGDVRDAALRALGIFKGRLGESVMSKHLQDLNPQKLVKLNESASSVKPSKFDKPEKKVVPIKAAPPPLKSAAAKKTAEKGKEEAKKTVEKSKEEVKKTAEKSKEEEKKVAQRKQSQEDVIMESQDEQPTNETIEPEIKVSSNNFDDQPIQVKKQPVNFEDMPISSKANNMNFEDMPISSKANNNNAFGEEELPMGGNKGGYNLDDLEEQERQMMAAASNKPKRTGPPARLQKAAKKEEAQEETKNDDGANNDDDMMMSPKADSSKAKPPQPKAKAAPKESAPKATAAPKTAVAKTAGGAAGGLQIQEEDLGSGLSKEEAEAKVQETFSAENVAKIDDPAAKWQDKVDGFKGFEEEIVELQPGQDVIEALAKYTKAKMKDWKESNVNLVKGTISLFTVVAKNCDKVNKRAVACLMPFLSEKIGDVKVMQSVHELLLALSELVGPKFIGLQVIKHASTAKAPKILQESCNILTQLSDEYGVVQMPMKEMIGYGTIGINNPNPAVRTSAMALFAMMFKHAGEMVRNFLKDIKESTMKVLEEEFAKVTPYTKGEFKAKRQIKGAAAEEMQIAGAGGKKGAPSGGGGGGFDDMMPREDISKSMTSKLMAMFKNDDWKERKKGADEVEKILRAANMRIQPLGLNELMDNFKQRMVDPNKSVLKSFIQTETLLIEALGPSSKNFIKKILPSLLACFADKQTLVRQDVNKCVDKWAEQVGAELVMNHLAPLLVQENPELRTEALTWIIKNKEAIKLTEIKELVKPMVSCLQDKIPSIRQMTEQVLAEVMPVAGYSAFQLVMKDLKPAVSQALKPQLEKIKNQTGAGNNAQDPNNGSLGQQKPVPITASKEEVKESNNSSLKGVAAISKPKLAGSNLNLTSGGNTATNKDAIPAKSTFAEAAMKKSAAAPISKLGDRSGSKGPSKDIHSRSSGLESSLKGFQENSQPPQQEQINIVLGLKERRAENDRKTKWQIEEIKGDQLEKLKTQTSQALGQGLCAKLFSVDFKLHNESIELFTQGVQNQPDQMTEILDLIFKWSQVKLGDSSNTQFAIKIFDFYAFLFKQLEENQYQLLDFEAMVIMPLLCDKAGINNSILKDKVKKLIRMLYGIYDKQKCYNGLMTYGLHSKNMRSQAECLDELEEFMKTNGIDYTTEKDLKLVAKLVDSNDKGIRENSLKVLGEVYKHLDNDIMRIIGEVPPKVLGLIEQRFKKVKGGQGMASSSSSQNLFQPENQIGSQNDRASPRQGATGKSNIGLKKMGTLTNIDNSKKTTTPRNLAFTKDKPTLKDQSHLNSSNSNFSKSINNFNTSNQSNEDQKKPPQTADPSNPRQGTFSNKASQLKKFVSAEHSSEIGGLGSKNTIPKTQRPDSSNTDFSQLNRLSGNNMQNKQQPQYPQPSQNSQKGGMHDFIGDDVDDFKLLTNEAFFVDTELDKQAEEIMKHIYQLKHGDLSKRVDSLVSLNEMISQIDTFKSALVRTSNDLINAFTHVLMDIFERPVEEIPLRFAKYFITIVLKACSCKEIMREASEESIFELAEQLLTRLLIEGLDKVGENKEGELILKNLNSSMLRLLENCNHTYIFCVLFNLLRKYKDFHKMPKLPGLIIKCLLKLSKILEKLIDKLDMEKILLAIHEYLVVINHENKTQNDEMGIRIVKTVTNELVKLKRDSIWDAYRVIQCHSQTDNHIYRWIQIILKSLQGQGGGASMSSSQAFSTSGAGMNMGSVSQQEQEIRHIIEELRNSEQFEGAVPKLYNFLESNPQVDLNEYLQECSKTFQDFIKKNLDKYKLLMKEESKTNEEVNMNSMKSTNNSDNSRGGNQHHDQDHKSGSQSTSNRVNEISSKLASIKSRFTTKDSTSTNREQTFSQQEQPQTQSQDNKLLPKAQLTLQQNNSQSSQQNLNTSFSDMNNRLTQKWNQINKKGTASKDSSHMSNTMGGFGSSQGLEKASVNMNQSSLGSGGQNENEQQNMQGASNSDLNKRLAEMKAKLQALKKPVAK